MHVKIGSARIDERGRTHGGKAGNQTGKELSIQNWYRHSKGWRVLRCTDTSKVEKIAAAMEAACQNHNIGYDQYERSTLYKLAKSVGFDPGKIIKPCETDCSALVRVCLAYAGIMTDNFLTTDEAQKILATGYFVELKDGRYTDHSDHLRRGDILVTRTKGHTVVVLNSGDKAGTLEIELRLGDRLLKKGMSGSDVRELQQNMLKLGYVLPKYGADGDFGDETEAGLKLFQSRAGLMQDGVYGSDTHETLMDAIADHGTEKEPTESDEPPKPSSDKRVRIVCSNGAVNIRVGNGTQYDRITTSKDGSSFEWVATAENGWHAVVVNGRVGWVSGKYGCII